MSNKRPPAWNSSPDDSQSTSAARAVDREEPGGIDAIGQQVDKLKPLLRAMRRHWMFGLWGLLGVGLLVGLFVARFNPKYRSETVIYHQASANPERLTGEQEGRADPMLLRELLLRHGRLEALIDEMGMYREMVEKVGKVAAVEELKKRISFQPLGRRTFRVGYVGDSPEEAQKVAARLAGSLIDDENARRQEQAKESAKFLEGEVAKATGVLQEKEEALERFIADYPDFAAAALNRAPATPAAPEKPAAKTKTKEKPTRTKKVRVRRRVPAAPGSGVPVTVPRPKPKPKPIDPKLAQERDAALRQLGQATRKLAQLQASYTDKHPEVMSAKSRVADAEARVAKANNAMMEASSDDVYDDVETPAPAPAPVVVPPPAPVEIEVEVPVAPKKKKGKKAKEKEKKPEPKVVPDKDPTATASLETEWARLTRGVNDSRDREERLINELNRANLSARSRVAGHDARVVVLDEAFLPARPVRSSRFFLKLGIPFALLVAFALVLLRAIIDDRIFVSDDLVARGFDPILSVVPPVRGGDA